MAETDAVKPRQYSGGCACGAIVYQANSLRPLWYCHCEQCRRMTGHFMAACQVGLSDLSVQGEPKWHYVSEQSRYGFCSNCGSQLFWRNDSNEYLSVTAGSLDSSEGVEVQGHIFTAEKGAYYSLPDDQLKYLNSWSSEKS